MTFKKFIVGFAIFILATLLIIFINEAINPKPKYSSYEPVYSINSSTYERSYTSYQKELDNYKVRSFITILILSLLVIIAAVFIRTVTPVSYGLLFAGVFSIIYIMLSSFEEIGKPARAIVTGVGLAILLLLAYKKFPDSSIVPMSGPSSADQPVEK